MIKLSTEEKVIKIIQANFLKSVGMQISADTQLRHDLNMSENEVEWLSVYVEKYFKCYVGIIRYKDWKTVRDVANTIDDIMLAG